MKREAPNKIVHSVRVILHYPLGGLITDMPVPYRDPEELSTKDSIVVRDPAATPVFAKWD